ncbi:MAG: MFS transporter [Spirochaetaceae bacterium]
MKAQLLPLYMYTLCRNLVFAYVIERLFWESRSMSVQDVVVVEIIFVILVFALEIPAGILADRVSRITLLMVAALAQAVEFAIIMVATRFMHFALAISVAAVGEVLVSGTFNAFVYEELSAEGRLAEFRRQLGRLRAFDSAVLVVALGAGGFLSEVLGMELLYAAGATGGLLAAVSLVGLRERRPVRSSSVRSESESLTSGDLAPSGPTVVVDEPALSLLEIVKQSLRAITTTPALLPPLIAGVVVAGSITYLDEFAVLHLRDSGLPVWSFGVIAAAVYLLHGAGSLLGERLSGIARRRGFYLALTLTMLIIQSLFGFISILLGIPLLLFTYLLWGAFEVLMLCEVHDAAESAFRATAESIVSQFQQLSTIAFGIVFGWLAARAAVGPAISLTAAIAFLAYLGVSSVLAARQRDV